MLRKFVALAGATALAGVGIGLAAGPANAAAPAHAPGSIFMHGTTRMAYFANSTTCQAYARYEVSLVAKNSATATLLPGVQVKNAVGSTIRFNCYPLLNGQWSYLTAYTSKTGQPIQPEDIYLDLSNRAAVRNAGTSLDTQSVRPFNHATTNRAGTTQTACNAQRDYILNEIQKSATLRLAGGDYRCTTTNGLLSYQLAYLSSTAKGLPYDSPVPNVTADQPMMDLLGYQFAGSIANNKVTPFRLTTMK